jgi:hypothetical protein
MLGFLKSLFWPEAPEKNLPEIPPYSKGTLKATNSYFTSMESMHQAISNHKYEEAASEIKKAIQVIPKWIKEDVSTYGEFVIGSIPALEKGGRILAFLGDDDGLTKMKNLVTTTPELKPWIEKVEQHFQERHLFPAILDAIVKNPKCLQTDIKTLVDSKDGRHIAHLISYLEKANKITRSKKGRTYELELIDKKKPPAVPKKIVTSHRKDRIPPPIHEIDISSIKYVPLPRSPLRWEEKLKNQEIAKCPKATEFFEVRDANWEISSVEKVPMDERPDPAFRKIHAINSGLLLIDDLGNAEGFNDFESAALSYDREGNFITKKGLTNSIYRLGTNPLGHGFISMSKGCEVHAYDQKLKSILLTSLKEAPEIQAISKKYGISNDNLKNHIRCVAISPDLTRYLFTVVNEAWCIDITGKGLWGVKLPVTEGWTRIAEPSKNYSTCGEIEEALSTMELALPVTPNNIKQRYRELAKKWHPDLNKDNPAAEKKMKQLTAAAEVLTGIDEHYLPQYTESRYEKEIERTTYETAEGSITFSFSYSVDELTASDWIYAASFAGKSNSIYLAGYSGRVISINENGNEVLAYDIGSVPRRIIDTDDFLYLLTDTRLYILLNDSLYKIIDTYDCGDLIVTLNGFGLLEKKCFRWFHEDGTYLGSIHTKNPIRRVYWASGKMIVETRQRRAKVTGSPPWWG